LNTNLITGYDFNVYLAPGSLFTAIYPTSTLECPLTKKAARMTPLKI